MPLRDLSQPSFRRSIVTAPTCLPDVIARGASGLLDLLLCCVPALLSVVWQEVFRPWFDVDGVSETARSLLTTARFVAEGAWTAQATGVFPAEDLGAVREIALRLVAEAEVSSVASSADTDAQEPKALA